MSLYDEEQIRLAQEAMMADPVGLEAAALPVEPETLEMPDLDGEDFEDAGEAEPINYQPKPVKKNPDGSVTFDDGAIAYPGGYVKRVMGDTVSWETPDGKKKMLKAAKADDKVESAFLESAARKGILREDFKDDKEFKQAARASLSGERGGGKMTMDQRKSISAVAKAGPTLSKIAQEYDALEARNKAGFIEGNVEKLKGMVSQEDPEFAKANARIRANLFGFARALQGAGVLTEMDIKRMEEISPTLQQNKAQFHGRLEAAKDIMRIELQSWKAANAKQIDPELEKELAAIESQLGGESKPAESTVPQVRPFTTPSFGAPAAEPSSTPSQPTSPSKDQYGFIPSEIYKGKDGTFARYKGEGQWEVLP